MKHFILGIFLMSMGFKFISSEYLIRNANKTIAENLKRKVKVVCGVEMDFVDFVPKEKKMLAIEFTWGRRCNKLVYLDVVNSAEKPMQQDQSRLRSLYNDNKYDGDWFTLIASNGYILLENLRYMLAAYNPNDAIYFMPTFNKVEGLKYILSKRALVQFLKANLSQIRDCNAVYDFISRSNCMEAIGLKRIESQDVLKRDRFLPEEPYSRKPQTPGHNKFWDCRHDSPDQTWDCFSDFAISFDNVQTNMLYVLDYLIYQLRPYGINFDVKLEGLKNLEKKVGRQNRRINDDEEEKNYDDDEDEENELIIPAPSYKVLEQDDDDDNTVVSAEMKKGSWNKYKKNSVVDKAKIKKRDFIGRIPLESGNWDKNERDGALNKPKIIKSNIKNIHTQTKRTKLFDF